MKVSPNENGPNETCSMKLGGLGVYLTILRQVSSRKDTQGVEQELCRMQGYDNSGPGPNQTKFGFTFMNHPYSAEAALEASAN